LEATNQFPQNENGKNLHELIANREWTHRYGVFNLKTKTNYETAHENIKFTAFEIPDLCNGIVLPNSRSTEWNSINIQRPMNYLESTLGLGKIVITQLRLHGGNHQMKLYFDVFPFYDVETIGPNPYFMYRETFDIKHLASIIPLDYNLAVPKLANPVDFQTNQSISPFKIETNTTLPIPLSPKQIRVARIKKQKIKNKGL